MATLYDFSAEKLSGEKLDLSAYKGRVVLVVNTASKCGLTPQLEGLQSLHDSYHEQGLDILGFPCNQFAGQEPGGADDISEVCHVNYGVKFDMFGKIDVNGSDTHPLFAWLKTEKSGLFGGTIKWNFTKFLVGRDGTVLSRYSPQTAPKELKADIEKALAVSPIE